MMNALFKSPLKYPKKILIVKPSSLGDIVHSLPFLNAIKSCFSKTEIHWVVAKGLEGLLEGHPMIDKLLIINKDAWKNLKNIDSTIKEIKGLLRNLKKERYDVVVDLQGLLRSGIITAATGAPLRVGFKEAREGSRLFYTHKVEAEKDIHAVNRYLKVAEFLGCNVTDVIFPFPLYQSTSSAQLIPSGNYAVIVPGARWQTKKWPAKKFGKLAAQLDVSTIIIGSKSDVKIADEIVALSIGKAHSLAGKTELKELIEIMKGAKFVVSNDSGPMHIAAALGIPVFAIFGPTDPLRTGPYGKGHIIIRENISCAPCFKKACDDVKCMKNLSVEEVNKVIKKKAAV